MAVSLHYYPGVDFSLPYFLMQGGFIIHIFLSLSITISHKKEL